MRAGFIVYGSPWQVSGGYLYDRKIVELLGSRNFEIEYFVIKRRNYLTDTIWNFSPVLIRNLIEYNPDVIIEDELSHQCCFILNRFLMKKGNFPIISLVHHLKIFETGRNPFGYMVNLIEKKYLDSVDGFIFNSYATRKAVLDFAECRKPSLVAYPGGNRFRFKIDNKSIDRRLEMFPPLELLFIGNIIPRKGIINLIRALEFVDCDWKLTVVGKYSGRSKYYRTLKKMIRNRDIIDRVEFKGQIDNKELMNCLMNSHVLTVPSSYEGFGIVYLEAMSFGIPVVATSIGGASEFVKNGKNGFLVEPDDYNHLANCIIRLCSDMELLREMSYHALNTYRNSPAWEDSIDRIKEFIYGFNGGKEYDR